MLAKYECVLTVLHTVDYHKKGKCMTKLGWTQFHICIEKHEILLQCSEHICKTMPLKFRSMQPAITPYFSQDQGVSNHNNESVSVEHGAG